MPERKALYAELSNLRHDISSSLTSFTMLPASFRDNRTALNIEQHALHLEKILRGFKYKEKYAIEDPSLHSDYHSAVKEHLATVNEIFAAMRQELLKLPKSESLKDIQKSHKTTALKAYFLSKRLFGQYGAMMEKFERENRAKATG